MDCTVRLGDEPALPRGQPRTLPPSPILRDSRGGNLENREKTHGISEKITILPSYFDIITTCEVR
jgi:hypothetical protein